MSYRFDVKQFFPRRLMDAITEARVNRPEVLEISAARRSRRARPTRNGKLNLLACDHPGRGVIAALDQPIRMGNRQEYLGRSLRILMHPGFDGVMAHTDLVEDLLILDYLIQEAGGPSFLDNRVVAGCMNRGGIHGVLGEIHDRFTSFSAESLARLNLDGGKMLIRAVNDDERTLMTVGCCAEAVTALSRRGLLAFVEPLPMRGEPGAYSTNYTVAELVKWVGICAGLGETSRNTWLKVPYIPDFEQVALATTLPILLLGGPARSDPMPMLKEFAAGMRCGKNVRGAMVGRNVLFPGDDDPLVMAHAVSAI
ncbi:MAG TPA: deoxyribose-phosphate aldolase, partial [Blastocatellia bacterium]|nr:deoxyribose-phosphate aldolase [Blastocatellia bacterium]